MAVHKESKDFRQPPSPWHCTAQRTHPRTGTSNMSTESKSSSSSSSSAMEGVLGGSAVDDIVDLTLSDSDEDGAPSPARAPAPAPAPLQRCKRRLCAGDEGRAKRAMGGSGETVVPRVECDPRLGALDVLHLDTLYYMLEFLCPRGDRMALIVLLRALLGDDAETLGTCGARWWSFVSADIGARAGLAVVALSRHPRSLWRPLVDRMGETYDKPDLKLQMAWALLCGPERQFDDALQLLKGGSDDEAFKKAAHMVALQWMLTVSNERWFEKRQRALRHYISGHDTDDSCLCMGTRKMWTGLIQSAAQHAMATGMCARWNPYAFKMLICLKGVRKDAGAMECLLQTMIHNRNAPKPMPLPIMEMTRLFVPTASSICMLVNEVDICPDRDVPVTRAIIHVLERALYRGFIEQYLVDGMHGIMSLTYWAPLSLVARRLRLSSVIIRAHKLETIEMFVSVHGASDAVRGMVKSASMIENPECVDMSFAIRTIITKYPKEVRKAYGRLSRRDQKRFDAVKRHAMASNSYS